MMNPKAAKTIKKLVFSKLTTDQRKELVKEKVNQALLSFEKVYKEKPNRLYISPELEVHLKDSREMTIEKKDYFICDLYAIVVELDRPERG